MAELESPKPNATLGDRMKSYEAVTEIRLAPNQPAVLRLDGHAFSKFTRSFARPFDVRIHDAMVSTCGDLLKQFPAATLAYTQSDEITLVFPNGVSSYNERVQKISTLAAAACSVSFNAHLSAAVAASPEPAVKFPELLGTAYFDCRLFGVPSVEEALNCVLWRCRGDAVRNAVSAAARTVCSEKELRGKTTSERLELMSKKGKPLEEVAPLWAREGTLLKREKYEVTGLNQSLGVQETALRSRVKAVDKGVLEFSSENLKLVTAKYWDDL
ncbi:hypothetical protein GQ53DRAFT_430623 [Thozetella sp. PMI_491]|nr:hypothetical protein GQ53DRAFT_430623 [Thozetella sp. PMI_491]